MILSKSQLVSNINNEISDNANSQISPYDIRHNLLDIIDSVHRLTEFNNLKANNFSTPNTRTTIVGELALDKINLDRYFSEDNTAVGYASLEGNYQGIKNTAVGAYSLHCNVYGQENIALGFNSLAGNTIGHRNVGIGSYSLHYNKAGSGNVAIGHAAGYYVSRGTSNKLFIASHAAVDSGHICDNPNGFGLIPLIYGDFSTIQVGIGVNGLHDYGKLQVAGDITPSINDNNNLGHPLYNWSKLYLSKSLTFSNSFEVQPTGNSKATINGDLLPKQYGSYDLGSESLRWKKGHFQDLHVEGKAIINNFVAIYNSAYFDKTLFLGVQTNGNPRLSDSEITGGGLVLKSSGVGYLRDYGISFYPEPYGMPCFEGAYHKAAWRSNISFQVPSGAYIKTNNIVSYNPDAFYDNDCFGLFFNSGITYISRKNVLKGNPADSNSPLAGIANVNFLSNSGVKEDYYVSISSIESGVSVGQRFLTGTKNRVKDLINSNKDKINGFELKYVDDSYITTGSELTDRFVVNSYDYTSKPVNSLIFMKNNPRGLLGITNINVASEYLLPETTFNIRSSNNAIARFAAENQGNTLSALQLVAGNNCLEDGFEVAYYNGSGIADLSMYRDSGKKIIFRLYDNYSSATYNHAVGLFSDNAPVNAMFTIGDDGRNAVVSLRRADFSTYAPPSTQKYGKLFVKLKPATFQSDSLFMIDGSGNVLDLYANKFDVNDARAVYTDSSFNTFVGMLSPGKRDSLSCSSNTSLGYKSLNAITTGSLNVSLGFNSATGISTGTKNIVIGNSCAGSLTTGGENIFIGNSIAGSILGSISGNIVIGNDGLGSSLTNNDNLLIGKNDSLVLLQGKLGPLQRDKSLSMPSGGILYINDNTNRDSLSFAANKIEVINRSGRVYPDNTLTFTFTGATSGNLLSLNYANGPMANNENYATSSSSFVRLDGDLRLRGSTRFSDGTSLSSASFLADIVKLYSNLNTVSGIAQSAVDTFASSFSNLFIEGVALNAIPAPTSPTSATSGIMHIKNAQWSTVGSTYLVNKDTTMVIHQNAYVIAMRMNGSYRPIWISSEDTACSCCPN
jgi:hypothetical protein